MQLALPTEDFHRVAEDIHNQWLEVLCQERVHYDDNHARRHNDPSSSANRPSDVAVTQNINA
jgi:hypothetical protein